MIKITIKKQQVSGRNSSVQSLLGKENVMYFKAQSITTDATT